MNRKTSVYTLHLPDAATTRAVARGFPVPLQDQGETSLSFRDTGDTAAVMNAKDAMAGLDDEWSLSTGLGIHRRWLDV